MEIRELDPDDINALTSFIADSYDDYPMAMWFDTKPPKENIARIVYSKIKGAGARVLADYVAEQAGVILGECEVVRTTGQFGVVGIMIRKEFNRKRIGTRLLDSTLAAAKEIGIFKVNAEVMEDNEPALRFFIVNGFAPTGSRRVEKNGKQRSLVILEKSLR